jgi:hypothetical protein
MASTPELVNLAPAGRQQARRPATSRFSVLLPSEGSGLPGIVTLGIALGQLSLYAGGPIANTGPLIMPGSRRSSRASAQAPALITRTTPAPDTDANTSRKTSDATAARIAPTRRADQTRTHPVAEPADLPAVSALNVAQRADTGQSPPVPVPGPETLYRAQSLEKRLLSQPWHKRAASGRHSQAAR